MLLGSSWDDLLALILFSTAATAVCSCVVSSNDDGHRIPSQLTVVEMVDPKKSLHSWLRRDRRGKNGELKLRFLQPFPTRSITRPLSVEAGFFCENWPNS